MLALVIFIVFMSTGNIIENSVEKSISYRLGEVRKRSTITSMMNDYMWRSPEVPYGKYSEEKAYKIISYYFSTPGDYIYLDGKRISKSVLRSDIKSYIGYKMNKSWIEGPFKVDWRVKINSDAPRRPQKISVGTYTPSARYSRISYPLALTAGRSATITLWTETSKNIYKVGGQH